MIAVRRASILVLVAGLCAAALAGAPCMPESEEAVFDRTGKRVAEEAFTPAQAPMPPGPATVLGLIR